MKKICYLVGTLLLLSLGAFAQQVNLKQDTAKRAKVGFMQEIPVDDASRKRLERDHYRRTLDLDSVKAEELIRIQSEYKSAVTKVVRDQSLSNDGKREAIDRLISLKNVQLGKLLSPEQQSKVIPTTERRTAAPNKEQQP